MFRFLPEQASEFAPDVDWIHNIVTDLSVFFTVAIVGAMLYFAIRYRQKGGVDHETDRIEGSHFLELVWTIVPTIICIFVAAYGLLIYEDIRAIPDDKNAIVISVTGRQWKWDFQYANGKKTTTDWVVPVNEPIKLVMTSTDVLHSLFLPEMRVKADLVPKQYKFIWFKPVKTGEYRTYCTEYCGTDHSAMLANLKVVSRAEYDRWLEDDSDAVRAARMKPSDLGKQLYTSKGCVSCHSLDGTKIVGPTFLKIWGKEEELADGTKVKVDENYVKSSILNPNSQVVNGFAPVMPSFQGIITDDEIHGLIEFIKTVDGSQAAAAPVKKVEALNPNATPAERGKFIYNNHLCVTCHSIDGSKLVGPSLKGLYGTKAKLADGSEVEVNDAFIKESIYEPQAKTVEGYPSTGMPNMFKEQLKDGDIADVIEFMKSLK